MRPCMHGSAAYQPSAFLEFLRHAAQCAAEIATPEVVLDDKLLGAFLEFWDWARTFPPFRPSPVEDHEQNPRSFARPRHEWRCLLLRTLGSLGNIPHRDLCSRCLTHDLGPCLRGHRLCSGRRIRMRGPQLGGAFLPFRGEPPSPL
eukprot:scaffold1170_cov256-Pinguiococcus_pyrenoidosus.AAC.6